MNMDAKELAALEEDLRRDLEAIGRVRQLMAAKSSAKAADDRQRTSLPSLFPLRPDPVETDLDEDSAPGSIRGTVETTINADPNVRWTTQKMLVHLQQTGFPLRAKKPIYSIGQAMQKLADAKKIRLVRKGAGNQPNIYKGLEQNQGGATTMEVTQSA